MLAPETEDGIGTGLLSTTSSRNNSKTIREIPEIFGHCFQHYNADEFEF